MVQLLHLLRRRLHPLSQPPASSFADLLYHRDLFHVRGLCLNRLTYHSLRRPRAAHIDPGHLESQDHPFPVPFRVRALGRWRALQVIRPHTIASVHSALLSK